jgi:hypothetical protein
MPAQSQWLLRVPEIRAEIEQLTIPVLDRALFETLFRVQRRRAHQLMHRFGGFQSGRTFWIERSSLLRELEQIEMGEAFTGERQRKQRLTENLEQLRKHSSAAKVHVRVEPEVMSTRLANLPEGVTLLPGQLTVSFETAEQLLERLFALAQALANDFDDLKRIVSTRTV